MPSGPQHNTATSSGTKGRQGSAVGAVCDTSYVKLLREAPSTNLASKERVRALLHVGQAASRSLRQYQLHTQARWYVWLHEYVNTGRLRSLQQIVHCGSGPPSKGGIADGLITNDDGDEDKVKPNHNADYE